MKDLRHDRLTRRGQRCTVAIEQAVEYGTQNYGDEFYLPVKPHPAGRSASSGDPQAAEPSATPPDDGQRRAHVPAPRDRSEETTRT
jgi:hypothetical protein